MSEAVTTGKLIRSIRLSADKINEILERRDQCDPPSHAGDLPWEYRYHSHTFRFRMQPAPAAGFVEHVSVSRKLSSAGVTVLIGQYVHNNTPCEVQLVSSHGSWENVPGIIKNCVHLEGSVHEVQIKFARQVDISAFCTESIQRNILLVESSSVMSRLAKHFLEEANAVVVAVDSGEDAVTAAAQSAFDVIIMDAELPQMNGLEATRLIRKAGFKGRIIAATAQSEPEQIAACMAAGCDLHLAKPYTKDALLHMLSTCHEEIILSSLASDPQLTPIIAEFVQLVPSQVQQLLAAFDTKNYESIESVVRKLRSEGGSLGFEPVAEAALRVEQRLHEKDNAGALCEAIDQLTTVCGLIRSNAVRDESTVPA